MQVLKQGDFVDVAVLCLIREDMRTRKLNVYWAPKEICQLERAAAHQVRNWC